MFQNLRSYFARSGGLLLLILAFLIVGVLAFLTIRAAQRGVNSTSDSDTGTTVAVGGNDTSSDVVNLDTSSDSSSSDTDSDSVAGDIVSGINTDDSTVTPETDVDTASEDDSVSSTTIDPDTDVKGATDLPNTGPAESAMIAAVAVGILGYIGSKYADSRTQLVEANRR